MSAADIILRANLIIKKYEKLEARRNRSNLPDGAAAFDIALDEMACEVDVLEQKARDAKLEKNPKSLAVLNAEIRRMKMDAGDKWPSLQKLARKKVIYVCMSQL